MQENAYEVKLIVTKQGERLPVLFKRDGTLHYYANLYSTIKLRTKSRASHTIENSLRAIAVLYYFLDSEGIDLERQLLTGEFLPRPTLERLNRVSRLTMQNITALIASQKIHQKEKVVHFEQFRRKVVPFDPSAEVNKKRQPYGRHISKITCCGCWSGLHIIRPRGWNHSLGQRT